MDLHARDLQGNLTTDMIFLQETSAGINQSSGMLIEASTGCLSDFTPKEKELPSTVPDAVMGSVNLGTINFGNEVYKNTPSSVNSWIQQMKLISLLHGCICLNK